MPAIFGPLAFSLLKVDVLWLHAHLLAHCFLIGRSLANTMRIGKINAIGGKNDLNPGTKLAASRRKGAVRNSVCEANYEWL